MGCFQQCDKNFNKVKLRLQHSFTPLRTNSDLFLAALFVFVFIYYLNQTEKKKSVDVRTILKLTDVTVISQFILTDHRVTGILSFALIYK